MSRYLLSISGGADSVYLMYKLLNEKVNFDLIHFNHQTRGIQNDVEEQFVKSLGQKYKMNFYVFKYEHLTGNFQHEARKFRQSKIKEIATNFNYDGVYLAHHKDDQVENILMHENKVGLKLMEEYSVIDDVTYIRPLLNIYKDEIYNFLNENDIKYFEDESNKSTKYLRNKVRKELSNLSKTQKDELVSKELLRYNKHESYELSTINYSDIKDEVVLHKFLVYNGFHMNHKFISMVYNSLSNVGNKQFYLDEHHCLYLNYGKLSIDKLNLESEVKKKISSGVVSFNRFKFINHYGNCYVRAYHEGEFFKSKKVSRYFIDLKIDKQYRVIWPILVDEQDNIIHIITKKEIL